jgi:nitrite reductase/ring-hydroxylating ferredoxin subunit
MGGATVMVTAQSIPGGKAGAVTITATPPATIKAVRIGGQEFAIDNVCAK